MDRIQILVWSWSIKKIKIKKQRLSVCHRRHDALRMRMFFDTRMKNDACIAQDCVRNQHQNESKGQTQNFTDGTNTNKRRSTTERIKTWKRSPNTRLRICVTNVKICRDFALIECLIQVYIQWCSGFLHTLTSHHLQTLMCHRFNSGKSINVPEWPNLECVAY